MEPLHCSDIFRFLNIGLQIRTDSEEMLQFFQDSYQRFRSSAPAEYEFLAWTDMNGSPWRSSFHSQQHEYGVLKTRQGFVFRCKDTGSGTEKLTLFRRGGQQQPISSADAVRSADVECTPEDQEHLFSFAQMALLNTLAGLLPEHHLFHGAALTWHGSGLILAGAAGQGKSSLSFALVKHGCKFLSDDIACVHLAGNQLAPFPRRLNLRQSGLPLLSRLLGDREISPGPVDMEEIFPNSIGGPSPLRHLILLKGIADRPEIRPISERQALLEALRLSHTPVHRPAEMLFRLAPLFSRLCCYELTAGDLDATAALICRQMEMDASR